jgi:uncharacterized protein YjbI with pentapeptide repeats/beta-lactamase regulating signal transducer with metallopeptidase domain
VISSFAHAVEPAARILVATLFNSLWEAAILAGLVALTIRALPNLSATTRYALWWVVLVASLVLPVATSVPHVSVQHAGRPGAVLARAQSDVRPATGGSGHAARSVAHSEARHVPSAPAPAPAIAPAFPQRFHLALPEFAALPLFALWGIVTLALLVRLAVNLWRLERLKSDAMPLPVEYREHLQRFAGADKGHREVRLCTCENIEVPVAVGLFDSMILLPKHLLDALSQTEVDQIVLHELAHLRRADDWTNGLQRCIQALLFFNPAIAYITQQLDLEREVACDDWVVDLTKEVRPYATCLTRMAEATSWPHRPLAAPGVFVTRRGLSVRVERLLRAGRNVRTTIALGPAGTVVACLLVLFFVLQNVAPSFAFTLPAAAAPAAAPIPAPPSPVPTSRVIVKRIDHYVTIPAQHIHVPARTIHVPAVNLDIPAQHFNVPEANVSFPPDFPFVHRGSVSQSIDSAKLQKDIQRSVQQGLQGQGFSGRYNCVGCDFSNRDLSGHDFSGQRLDGTDFSHANLRGADFSNSELVGVDFSGANLEGAKFRNARLNGCDLRRTDVRGANLTGVQMTGCDFDARDLSPDQAASLLRGCRTGCDFSGANLEGQDLRNLVATGIDLNHSNLRNADFSGSRLSGVDFSDSKMDGARFDGADLTGCDFGGVNLNTVDLSNARVVGSDMNDR